MSVTTNVSEELFLTIPAMFGARGVSIMSRMERDLTMDGEPIARCGDGVSRVQVTTLLRMFV